MIVFSILGCINALGYFLLQSQKLFWVAAILSPLGWTFFNICGVFTHSYLPIYGRVHRDVLAAQARGESQKTVRKIEEQVVNDLSAYSVGIANVGSVIVHAVSIGISLAMKESMLGLEIAIAFTGIWWLMWMLIVTPWLDARPGLPMPKGKNWIAYSWKKSKEALFFVFVVDSWIVKVSNCKLLTRKQLCFYPLARYFFPQLTARSLPSANSPRYSSS